MADGKVAAAWQAGVHVPREKVQSPTESSIKASIDHTTQCFLH